MSADVVVAALFEEVRAAGRRACGRVLARQSRFPREARRRTCASASRRVAQGALDGAGGGLLGAEHGFGVAGELVEALGGEADAEVVGGDLFELVGLVEDDGGGVGQDAGVGRVRRPAA